MKKLHNERGETLIEVLASIIIASLSLALMFGCIMASTKMDEDAKELDEQHYIDLTEADAQDAANAEPVNDDVRFIKIERELDAEEPLSTTLPITIYGDEERMSSYSHKNKSTGGSTP